VKWHGDKMDETPRAPAAHSRVGHGLHSCAKRRGKRDAPTEGCTGNDFTRKKKAQDGNQVKFQFHIIPKKNQSQKHQIQASIISAYESALSEHALNLVFIARRWSHFKVFHEVVAEQRRQLRIRQVRRGTIEQLSLLLDEQFEARTAAPELQQILQRVVRVAGGECSARHQLDPAQDVIDIGGHGRLAALDGTIRIQGLEVPGSVALIAEEGPDQVGLRFDVHDGPGVAFKVLLQQLGVGAPVLSGDLVFILEFEALGADDSAPHRPANIFQLLAGKQNDFLQRAHFPLTHATPVLPAPAGRRG
jgi:hypothetical protein